MASCKNYCIKGNFFVRNWSLACRTGNGKNCFLRPSNLSKVFHLEVLNISYTTCNFIGMVDGTGVIMRDKKFK
jgi:hypothetical protein